MVPANPALVVATRTDYDSGDPFLVFLDPATGAEKLKVAGEDEFGTTSYGDCLYDEQSVVACRAGGVLTAYDAATAAKLWSLPDEAANRMAPGLVVAWHGALYGETGTGQPIVLDAKTGKDRAIDGIGLVPALVSKYVGIGAADDGTPTAYPVKK